MLAVLKDVSDQVQILVLLMRLRLIFPVGRSAYFCLYHCSYNWYEILRSDPRALDGRVDAYVYY